MITHPAIAEQEQTCGACPEQYEGRLVDGRHFYLRYRWGVARLGLGATADAAVEDPAASYMEWGDNLQGQFDGDVDFVFQMLYERHEGLYAHFHNRDHVCCCGETEENE